MESACYKCDASVDQGIAFCPQCRAPQIRVMLPEPVAELPLDLEAAADTDFVTPAVVVSSTTKIDWKHGLRASTIAGVAAALLMMFPLGAFGVGMLTAGLLAVVLYQRRTLSKVLTPGMGMRLGVVSGAIGFIVFTVLSALETIVFGADKLRAALLQAVQQSAAKNPDPQAQQVFELLKSPFGLAMVLVFGLLFILLISLAFSGLGGMIAGALYRRRSRPRL